MATFGSVFRAAKSWTGFIKIAGEPHPTPDDTGSASRTEVVPGIKLSPRFQTPQMKPGQGIMGKNELSAWEETVGLLKPSGYPAFRRDRAVPPKPWVLCREAWVGQC